MGADLEAERLLLTSLRTFAPSLGVLSEEAGREGNEDHYWIVDPAGALSQLSAWQPVLCHRHCFGHSAHHLGNLISVPAANELFTAIQGQGASLNGTRIHVSQTDTLRAALVHVGDLTKEDDPVMLQAGLREIAQLSSHSRRMRMRGLAAIDLASLACGRADVLVNHAESPWDIEAGRLLLLEAEGTAISRLFPPHAPRHIYSNGVLQQAVENLFHASSRESGSVLCWSKLDIQQQRKMIASL